MFVVSPRSLISTVNQCSSTLWAFAGNTTGGIPSFPTSKLWRLRVHMRSVEERPGPHPIGVIGALTEDLDLLSRVVEPASGKRGPDPGCGGSVRECLPGQTSSGESCPSPCAIALELVEERPGPHVQRTQFVTEDMSLSGEQDSPFSTT